MYKFINIIKFIGLGFLTLFFTFTFLVILLSDAERYLNGIQLHHEATIEFAVFGIISLICWVFFLRHLFTNCRCKKCKGFFTLAHKENQLLKSEDTNVVVTNNQYNNQGKKTGYHEQRVPGVKETWIKIYVCKKCGNQTYKQFTDSYEK